MYTNFGRKWNTSPKTCSGIGIADWWSVSVCVTADRKWYIYCKLLTPCPGVSLIKRLSLYEFAPKGRDLVSAVRIREGLYYRGFFQRKCMRILSVHRRQTVCNREVSAPRGSTVVYYSLSAWLQCYLQIYNPRKKSWNTCVCFPFPKVDLGITVVSVLQNTCGSTLGTERAHYSGNKSVRSKSQEFSRKFKRNSVCFNDLWRVL